MNENDILMWIIEEAKKSTQVLDAEQRKPANRRNIAVNEYHAGRYSALEDLYCQLPHS